MNILSLKRYVMINGFVMLLSIMQYMMCIQNIMILTFISFILKNLIIVKVLDYIVSIYKNKTKFKKPIESYPNEFNMCLLKISIFDCAVYEIILNIFNFVQFNMWQMLFFIPISFMFEIIFDFFHYWSHRIMHSAPTLYKLTHKQHHKHISLMPVITFVQDPIDLIISNMFPNVMTLIIFQLLQIKMSLFVYICILMYKSYVEVAGHCGIENNKTCSFPQCIWLPKLFGIELYSKNHSKHHSNPNVNFSKRFNLWDKVFGTWKN